VKKEPLEDSKQSCPEERSSFADGQMLRASKAPPSFLGMMHQEAIRAPINQLLSSSNE